MDLIANKSLQMYSKLLSKLPPFKLRSTLLSLVSILLGGIMSQLGRKALSTPYSDQVRKLENDKTLTENKIEALVKPTSTMSEKIKEQQEKNEKLEEDIQTLIDNQNHDIRDMELDLETLIEKHDNLSAQLDPSAKEELDRLHHNLLKEYKHLQATLNNEIDTLQEMKKEDKSKREELKTDLAEMEQQVERLRKMMDEAS